jgi:hypothetical protein
MIIPDFVNNFDFTGIQADKVLHIKTSAGIVFMCKYLPIKSLCYLLTMLIGLGKEIYDFFDPNGHCEIADLIADHVGACAIFGKEVFEKQYVMNKKYFTG